MPGNVRHIGHVYTREHNAFNTTPLAVLNIARDSMAAVGFSPATRVFEACGAGACLITDAWAGLDLFLEEGKEVLVARDGQDVADHVAALTPERARAIGDAARARDRRRAYLRAARRGGGRHSPGGGAGQARAQRRMNRRRFRSSCSASACPRPGATATPRPTALCCEPSARAGTTCCSWSATCRGTRATATCPTPLLPLRAVPGSRRPGPPPRRDCRRGRGDRRLLRAGRRSGRPPRARAGAASPRSTTSTRRSPCASCARGDHEYLGPDLIPGYDLYLSFTGGPTLRVLEQEWGSPAARQLYCSVDPEAYPRLDAAKRWDLSYLGTYSDDRQPTLERLLLEPARRAPHLRFAVAGPQYPARSRGRPTSSASSIARPLDHPAFYAASRYTLNVTRADMIAAGYSPSVRLFEAAATGTPIVSDSWDGLDTILAPGREILVAQTSDDVLAVLTQRTEAERQTLADAARASVLARHSAAHRAAELEETLREVIATKSGRRRHDAA